MTNAIDTAIEGMELTPTDPALDPVRPYPRVDQLLPRRDTVLTLSQLSDGTIHTLRASIDSVRAPLYGDRTVKGARIEGGRGFVGH